jgi:hypothetical protein
MRRHQAFLKKTPYIKVSPIDSLLHEALPTDHYGLGYSIPLDLEGENKKQTFEVSYGEYLLAIKRFLLGHWDLFLEAVSRRMACSPSEIDELIVRAEKHGSDYHPARVVVRAGGGRVSFVVNVALSSRGRNRLEKEFFCLKALHAKHDQHYTPEVHFLGDERILLDSGLQIEGGMFFGEWFEGFHEFHLSRDNLADSLNMVIWDEDQERRGLSTRETMELYRQTSFILTYYYDTETFSEIFPWHHAAGDFVAACSTDNTKVKLIAVRQYAPRTEFEENCQGNRIQALLLFLANLTIRMRLDRLDGTGETVWAPNYCIPPVVSGFLDGLTANSSVGGNSLQIRDDFVSLLKKISPGNLAELFSIVTRSYHGDAPDVPVISKHLADHIFEFYSFVTKLQNFGSHRV